MPWQDWVLSIGGFVLLLSLVPTLRGEQKPALTTSVMSAGLIAIFAVTLGSLGLWLTALANAGMSLAWGTLAVQRYQMEKRAHKAGLIEQIEEEVEVSLGIEEPHPV